MGVAIRRYQHGRLIHDRRTGPIVWATLVRLATTAALALAGIAALPDHGPLVAGAALSVGAFLEAAALLAFGTRPPAALGPAGPRWTALAVHHGHLSAARLLVMAPTVVTILGVAHAARAADSLIVWPVLIQLTALFTSPTTDWESVAATALRDDPRSRQPARLTTWLSIGTGVLFAATVLGGPGDLFVHRLLAVPEGPADLGLSWAWLLLPMPSLWIVRAYLRGAVMAAGAPRWLSVASLAHTSTLVVILITITRTDLPGVACAGIALTGGVTVETLVTLYAKRLRSAIAVSSRGWRRWTRVSRRSCQRRHPRRPPWPPAP